MLLKYIKLQNIRSYVDEKIEFPTGSTLLAGEIGSGKSSILLAIEFALFGVQRGELTANDLLRHGSNLGSMELCFELNGKNVVICRNLKRDKKGISQETGYIDIDGVRDHKTASELRAVSVELIGYPQEYMTKNPIMFRYTVYTPQDEMKRILFSDSAERLNILRKIFDIDKYGRVRDNASNILMKELRSIRRELDLQTSDIEKKNAEIVVKKKLLGETEANITSTTILCENSEKELKEKEKDLERVQEKVKEINKSIQEFSRLKATLEQKEIRFKKIEQEISIVAKKTESVKVYAEKEIIAPEILDEKIISEKKTSLEKNKQEITIKKGALDNEIKKLENILKNGLCDFCGQHVNDPESFKERIEEKLNNLKSLSEAITDSSTEIEQLEKIRKELLNYSYDLKIKADKQLEYSELIDKKDTLDEEKQTLSAEITELRNKLLMMKDISADLLATEIIEKNMKKDMSELRKKHDDVSKLLSKLEQQGIFLRKEIDQLQIQVEEKQKAREKSAKIGEISSWLEKIFVPLMESMEQNIMSSIQQEFNQFFQLWFSVLIPDENISVRVDEQFSPIIEQAGYQTEYQNLSGGEKTSVALAYRLALNKVINSLVETIKTKDLIILDEPTDGFSMDQLDRIRDVIQELNLKQMIIVSHEPKIDTYVDNVIRFYKEGHISRVAR